MGAAQVDGQIGCFIWSKTTQLALDCFLERQCMQMRGHNNDGWGLMCERYLCVRVLIGALLAIAAADHIYQSAFPNGTSHFILASLTAPGNIMQLLEATHWMASAPAAESAAFRHTLASMPGRSDDVFLTTFSSL